MKRLLTLLLLFCLTVANKGEGAGTVVKTIGNKANVRDSEGAGTTTLTSSDLRDQFFNLSASRTVKLPSTGVAKGERWTFKNVGTGGYTLSIQPSGVSVTMAAISSVNSTTEAVALVAAPTGTADWAMSVDSMPACSQGYVLVPKDNVFTFRDFCVMKYHAKLNGTTQKAESLAASAPWVSIPQPAAAEKCKEVGTHLITNAELMTVARNIGRQPLMISMQRLASS